VAIRLLFYLLMIGLALPVLGDGVQLGPRPFYLVERMEDSALKRRLQACGGGSAARKSCRHRKSCRLMRSH